MNREFQRMYHDILCRLLNFLFLGTRSFEHQDDLKMLARPTASVPSSERITINIDIFTIILFQTINRIVSTRFTFFSLKKYFTNFPTWKIIRFRTISNIVKRYHLLKHFRWTLRNWIYLINYFLLFNTILLIEPTFVLFLSFSRGLTKIIFYRSPLKTLLLTMISGSIPRLIFKWFISRRKLL